MVKLLDQERNEPVPVASCAALQSVPQPKMAPKYRESLQGTLAEILIVQSDDRLGKVS